MAAVLLVCDSVGSEWGASGYAKTLARKMASHGVIVDVRSYGGVPIAKVRPRLFEQDLGRYDVIVVHLGNPDVHPRMPRRPLQVARKAGFSFCRDGLFFVPPSFGPAWVIRLPFFLLRLAIVRNHGEYYATVEEIIEEHVKLVAQLSHHAPVVLTIPIFEVSAGVFGPAHNDRARRVCHGLRAEYGVNLVTGPIVDPETYGPFRNCDWFHLKQPYHELLADYLMNRILPLVTRDTGSP